MENVTEELVRQNGNQAAAVIADYAGQGGGGGSTGGISLNEPQATLTFRQATQSDVAKFSHASNIIAVAEINGIIPVIVTSVDNSGSILVSYFLSTGYFGQNSNTSQLRAMYMGAKANTGNPIITTSSLYISDDGTLFGLAGVSQ